MKVKNNINKILVTLLALSFLFFRSYQTVCSIRCMSCSNEIDIYRNNVNDNNKISLTFDDGPHPRYTVQILQILKKYNIRATFFAIGINAHQYPETLDMIVSEGHEIANHTYTHPSVSHIDRSVLTKEIEKCEHEIFGLTEHRTKLFRPPEGLVDRSIIDTVKALDYEIILWDIDTRDWAHTAPEIIAQNVLDNIHSGDIILMHDFIGHDSPTPDALEILLPRLIEQGFNFVTVSELIGIHHCID